MQNKKFQKLLDWAELFQKEHTVKPNKLRGARLLFIHASFMAQFIDILKEANKEDKKVLREIATYVPSTPELIALFIRVDTDKIVSSRSLAKYSPELRTELIKLRDEKSFLKAKEKYKKNLDQIVDLLKKL